MAIGNIHTENAILSHELKPEVQAIYLAQFLKPIGVKMTLEKYADRIDVPNGEYGSNGAYDGAGTYSDINNIRMRGEDNIARYIMYGADGLAVRQTAVGAFAGTIDPFDTDIEAAAKNAYGTAPLSVANITRAWEDTLIPEGHEGLLNQLENYDTDLLGMFEVNGFVNRMGRVKWFDEYSNIMMPTRDNLYITRQLGDMAATYSNIFYRSQIIQKATQYLNDAGTIVDATTSYDEFFEGLDFIAEQLEFFGVQYIADMVMGSTRIGSQPLEPGFRVIIHPKLKNWLYKTTNPDFIRRRNYAEPCKDPDEIGAYNNCRFVVDETLWNDDVMAAAGSDVVTLGTADEAQGDIMVTGAKISHYNFLIFGEKAYTMLKMRGTENFKLMTVPAKAEAGNPLAQYGSIGYVGHNGFMMGRQTDVWCMRVKLPV